MEGRPRDVRRCVWEGCALERTKSDLESGGEGRRELGGLLESSESLEDVSRGLNHGW